jgi:hypothetical protein
MCIPLFRYGDVDGIGLTVMAHDDTKNGSGGADIMAKQRLDELATEPPDGVLVLLREVANRQRDGNHTSRPVIRQAEIRERVLRRVLENSLDSAAPVRSPHLKIIK